jgi:hypothetical protein
MRRSLLLVGALGMVLSACGEDAFRGHPDVVARAAGQELSTERLADIMTRIKGIAATAEEADLVASIWTDYTLFAQAIAEGKLEDDSLAIREVMWGDIAEAITGQWWQHLVRERGGVTIAEADSLYRSGEAIVVQHILLKTDGVPANQKSSVRRDMDRIAQLAKAPGADFGALAIQYSQDVSTLADSGFMGPVPAGFFVPEFDAMAWSLAPGQVSPVVETSFGYHVIRRASDAQAIPRFENVLMQRASQSVEAEYFTELDADVSLNKGAPNRVREIVADINAARGNQKKIGSYGGTPLTIDKVARWIRVEARNPVQAPQFFEQIRTAPDSMIEMFTRYIAQRYLMIDQAEAAGYKLETEEWDEITASFRAQVDTVKQLLALDDSLFLPNAPLSERKRAAALKVDQFLDQVADGSGPRLRALPGVLSWTLRSRDNAATNPAGINQTVSMVRSRLGLPEEIPDPTAGMPQPQVVPAPGGPPVGTPSGANP